MQVTSKFSFLSLQRREFARQVHGFRLADNHGILILFENFYNARNVRKKIIRDTRVPFFYLQTTFRGVNGMETSTLLPIRTFKFSRVYTNYYCDILAILRLKN